MQHSVLPQRRYSQAAASRTLPAFSLGKGYARRHSLRESAAATFSATSLLHANYVACCNQCTLRVFDCIAHRASRIARRAQLFNNNPGRALPRP